MFAIESIFLSPLLYIHQTDWTVKQSCVLNWLFSIFLPYWIYKKFIPIAISTPLRTTRDKSKYLSLTVAITTLNLVHCLNFLKHSTFRL
jgi:hypothetical protein